MQGDTVSVFLSCVVIVFVLLLFLSKRAIRPFTDNLERQRRFITDASHELKTPLAILSADIGLLEDTYGNDKWLESARSQIVRLDMDSDLAGDIYVGAGETEGVHFLTRTARKLQAQYPQLHFHISSGDARDVTDQLDKGLIDFGLLFEPINQNKYNTYRLPVYDTWGVLMRRDSPLAEKTSISPRDITDKPLIVSRNLQEGSPLDGWLGKSLRGLNIAATYSLAYNASLMVEDGMGYALVLDRIINTSGDSPLCFRPLAPALHAHMSIVWKKYQVFSKPAEKFLTILRMEDGEPKEN